MQLRYLLYSENSLGLQWNSALTKFHKLIFRVRLRKLQSTYSWIKVEDISCSWTLVSPLLVSMYNRNMFFLWLKITFIFVRWIPFSKVVSVDISVYSKSKSLLMSKSQNQAIQKHNVITLPSTQHRHGWSDVYSSKSAQMRD